MRRPIALAGLLAVLGCGRTFFGQTGFESSTDTDGETETDSIGSSLGPTMPDPVGDPDTTLSATMGPTTDPDTDTTPTTETDTVGSFCGDNFVDAGEVCDGTQLLGQDCVTQGFAGGELACLPDCSGVDASGCFGAGDCCEANPGVGCEDAVCSALVCQQDPFCCTDEWDQSCADAADFICLICEMGVVCGDGEIGRSEVCDGFNLGGETCTTQGFDDGDLSCSNECSSFDTSQCFDYTGECCEPNFTPGCDDDACVAVICPPDPFCCDTEWDDICASDALLNCAVCVGAEVCGNDVIDGDDVCDGSDLGGQDCTTQGFDRGTLDCLPDCSGFDTDGCADFEGGCCFDNGTPGCDDPVCTDSVCMMLPACCTTGWDIFCAALAATECSICMTPDVCGNSILEPPELCDGGDLGGEDCFSQGFLFGELACSGDCMAFDTSACVASDCCVVHAATGCDDPACELAVCSADSYCCDTTWDALCVLGAEALCPALCPTG